MALASALPVSVRVLSLVMPSPAVPLSVEYDGNRRGDRGRGVDGDAQRRGRRAGIAGDIGGGGGQAVGAVGERGRREGPVPLPSAVALPSSVAPS